MDKRYINIAVVTFASIEIGDNAITDGEAITICRNCIESANDGNEIMRDALINHPVDIGRKRAYLLSELVEVGGSPAPVIVDSVADLIVLSHK